MDMNARAMCMATLLQPAYDKGWLNDAGAARAHAAKAHMVVKAIEAELAGPDPSSAEEAAGDASPAQHRSAVTTLPPNAPPVATMARIANPSLGLGLPANAPFNRHGT